MKRDPFNSDERKVLNKLTSPAKIQQFLDTLKYRDSQEYRCPREVLRTGKAQCFEGATLAAAALRRIGYEPLLFELAAERDDDHVLALFRHGSYWGVLGKSNFVGLRYREPIFLNIREIALSFFEGYFNLDREKTLREYSGIVNLSRFDKLNWETEPEAMERIACALESARHSKIVPSGYVKKLLPVDDRSFRAGTLGTSMAGVYKP